MEEKEIKEQMGGKPEEIIPETPKDILIEILKTLKEGFKSLSEKIDTGFNSLSEKIDNGFNSLSKKIDEALYYQKDGQKIPYLKRIYEGLYYQEDGQEKSYLGQIIEGIKKIRSEGNEWDLLKLYISEKSFKKYRITHIPEGGADFILELESRRNYFIIEIKNVLNENTLKNAIEQLIKRGNEVNCLVPKVGVILSRFLAMDDKKIKEVISEKEDEIYKVFHSIELCYFDIINKKIKILEYKK